MNNRISTMALMLRAVRKACQMRNGVRVTPADVRWAAQSLGGSFDLEALNALVDQDMVIRAKNGRVRATLSPEQDRDQEDTEVEVESIINYNRAQRRNPAPSPVEEVEALYRDFARERDRIAGALGEGYNSLQDFTDEEPCPDDDLDRVRRAGVYLLGYDPAIFKQTKRGRELREHLRAWVRWLAWMADRCEERVAEGWWVEAGGWEAPRGHGRR